MGSNAFNLHFNIRWLEKETKRSSIPYKQEADLRSSYKVIANSFFTKDLQVSKICRKVTLLKIFRKISTNSISWFDTDAQI